ncbi:MAG: TonB-dependent receptor [Acidobacteriota bacterium]
MIRRISMLVVILAASPLSVFAQPAAPAATSSTVVQQETPVGAADDSKKNAEMSRLSEGLVYSVDRTPERTFDAARAVEVITGEELRRRNGVTLGDFLQEDAGVAIASPHPGGIAAGVRGLGGRQVMILIDGMKVNDALWRSPAAIKEQLNLIDTSMIERIEIVRGVVSVLGTEALGGVINIITRRGPSTPTAFGGIISGRYASADQSYALPLELFGQTEKFRYTAGGTIFKSGDTRGGEGIGTQPHSGYSSTAFHFSTDYFLSPEKMLSAGYTSMSENDLERPLQVSSGLNRRSDLGPINLTMGHVSYQDLTSRGWEESLKFTAFFNRQIDGTNVITTAKPTLQSVSENRDNMLGLNLEAGSFLGSQHLLYGLDYSNEKVASIQRATDLTTGTVTYSRATYIPGSTYRSVGIYLNDRFDLTRWLTATVGARYGSFRTAGSADTPLVGFLAIDSTQSGVTSAVNLVFHATPELNLIANAMRGFRAATLDDVSRYRVTASTGIDIPSPGLQPERVKSYEAGAKYENQLVSASAFYFRNSFTNLVTRGLGYYNGLTFADTNKNGVKDKGELDLHQNFNLGSAVIKGYELELRVRPTAAILLFGNYTKMSGPTGDPNQTLANIIPHAGTAGVRYTMDAAHNPWGELVMRYASAAEISGLHTDGYHVLTLRTGARITPKFDLTLALENVTNEAYRYYATQTTTSLYSAARQLVVGTRYHF